MQPYGDGGGIKDLEPNERKKKGKKRVRKKMKNNQRKGSASRWIGNVKVRLANVVIVIWASGHWLLLRKESWEG